jgi:DNA-binding NtrC family response regulator
MRGEPGRAAESPRVVNVLVVDDEADYRDALCNVLARRGYCVGTAASGEEALQLVSRQRWDVMVLDLKMPGLDGLATLQVARRVSPRTEVILLTGHGSVDAGLHAMRGEAFDFLLKPTTVDQLLAVIEAAAAMHRPEPDTARRNS